MPCLKVDVTSLADLLVGGSFVSRWLKQKSLASKSALMIRSNEEEPCHRSVVSSLPLLPVSTTVGVISSTTTRQPYCERTKMKDSKFTRRNATALTWVFLLAVGAVLSIRTTHAFTTTSRHVHSFRKASLFAPQLHNLQVDPRKQQQNGGIATRSATGTELFMYNLPPGGGGGGNNGLGDIAKGILGLVLVVGFFASPLGGLVLGVFNSLLLLSILAPILIGIAFQTWQFLNTIEAPCPNCGATVKVIKTNKETGEAVPTLCYSCGAILQANYDNTGIDNVSGRKSVMDDASAMNSIFDIFGGSAGGSGGVGGSAFDVTETTTTTTTTTTTDVIQERGKKETRPKRDQNVIDVEIEDDDGKPWQ